MNEILDTTWIVIYKDTYNKQYNGDDNLMEILIFDSVLYDYYIKYDLKEYYNDYNDFLDNYICEDVDHLFDFAFSQGEILDTRFVL